MQLYLKSTRFYPFMRVVILCSVPQNYVFNYHQRVKKTYNLGNSILMDIYNIFYRTGHMIIKISFKYIFICIILSIQVQNPISVNVVLKG